MGRDSRAPLSRRRWLLRLIVGGMLGALLNGLVSLTLKPRTYGANMSGAIRAPTAAAEPKASRIEEGTMTVRMSLVAPKT